MKFSIDDKELLIKFIKEKNFYLFIVIKFSIKGCFPCEKMSEIFGEIEKKRKDILFVEIDAKNCQKLSKDEMFSVYTVPKIFIFHKGLLVKVIDGYVNFFQLNSFLNLKY